MSRPNSVKKKSVSSTNQKPPARNAQSSTDALSPKGKESKSGGDVSTGSMKGTLPSKADLAKFKRRLERPASVSDSFYDKFERLERECSDNVIRITSGKVSSKPKKKATSKQKTSTSLLDRKKPKGDSLEGVSQNKSKHNPESFFEMAIKYDTDDLKATSSGQSKKSSNKKGGEVLRATSTSSRKRLLASSPSQKRVSSAKYRSISRSERNRSKSRHRSHSSRHDRQGSRNDRKRRSRSQSSKSSDKSGRSSVTRRGRSRRRKSRSRSRRTSRRKTTSCSTSCSKNSSRRNSLKRSKKPSRSSSVTSKDSSVSKRSNVLRRQSVGNENTGRKLSRTKDRALSGSSAVNSARRQEMKTNTLKSYDHNSKQKGQQEKDKAYQGIQGKITGCGVKGLKIINDLINNSGGTTMKMPSKCLPFSNTRKVC